MIRIFRKKKKVRKNKFLIIFLISIVVLSGSFFYYRYSQASYTIVSFTEVGNHTWTVPEGVTSVDVLVVAGGGGGGGFRGGGGGAGELVFKSNYSVIQGESILIEVGDGGAGGVNSSGYNGEQSKFGSITAIGGGGGATTHYIGNNGGSGGGGGCNNNNGGSSIAVNGFGNNGGYGPTNWNCTGSAGGGGGAGGVGLTPEGGNGYIDNPGNGGAGMYFGDVFGNQYGENGWFAGGGGGGTEGHISAVNNSSYDRPMGSAGGGNGGMIEYIDPIDPNSSYNQHSGTNAVNGTGSGGGGGNYKNTVTSYGGNGGSGIVLIKYRDLIMSAKLNSLQKGLVGHWSMDEVDYVEGTENILSAYVNPTFENGEISGDGWNFDSKGDGVREYTAEDSYNGIYSIKLTNATNDPIAFWKSNIPVINGQKYTISVYAKNINCPTIPYFSGVNISLDSGQSNSFTKINSNWERFTATYTATITGNAQFYIRTNKNATQGSFLIDNFQIEKKDHTTPFVNGTRAGKLNDKTPYINNGSTGIEQSFSFSEDRQGKEGGAMSFNGDNNYIEISDFSSFNADSFTISMWINPNTPDGEMDIPLSLSGTGDRGHGISFYLYNTENKTFYFVVRNPDGSWDSVNVGNFLSTYTDWIHVVGTYSNNTKKLYINGNFIGQKTSEGTYDSFDKLFISDENYPYNGLMDDVRIYNRALSDQEVTSLFNSYNPKITTGSLQKGLILDMPLTSKYVKTETAGSEIMADRTPYSNDGQNYGATISEDGGSFDGNDDYINCGNDDRLNFGSNSSYAISMWIKSEVNNFSGGDVIGKFGSSNQRIHFYVNNGILYRWEGFSGPLLNTVKGWQYIAYTYIADGENNGTEKFYENGQEINSRTGVMPEWKSTGDWIIGSGSSSNYFFNGQISNVKIYNRELSEEEVKMIYDKEHSSSNGLTIKAYGSTSDMPGKSCSDILENNPSAINLDGLYWVDPNGANPFQVYCDMTTDGGGWTLILNQDVDGVGGGFFSNSDDAKNKNESNPNASLYSILDKLEFFRSNGKFTLKINWPDLGTSRNIWKQTINPVTNPGMSPTRPVEGYEAISIDHTNNYWGGLEQYGSSCFLDGSVMHSNWYYAIGSYSSWGGGIPSYSPASHHAQLWVK